MFCCLPPPARWQSTRASEALFAGSAYAEHEWPDTLTLRFPNFAQLTACALKIKVVDQPSGMFRGTATKLTGTAPTLAEARAGRQLKRLSISKRVLCGTRFLECDAELWKSHLAESRGGGYVQRAV